MSQTKTKTKTKNRNRNNPRPPTVDEAPLGILDPQTIPTGGATVRIKPWEPMTYRDVVSLFVGESYTDQLPIGADAVGEDVEFKVLASEFVADGNDNVPIRYEVQLYQGGHLESDTLDLKLQKGFDAAATLDLSTEHYVVSVDKPPPVPPPAARMTRVATWGQAPYTYESTDPLIASADAESGEIIALSNGACTIRATDSQNKSREYPLTVKGIQEVYFLTHAADWEGMISVCTAAQLQPITLAQTKRLWALYFPDSGPVGFFLGLLDYPVWTGDVLGADTAWTYDLNGFLDNDNASSQLKTSYWQVLGISQA